MLLQGVGVSPGVGIGRAVVIAEGMFLKQTPVQWW